MEQLDVLHIIYVEQLSLGASGQFETNAQIGISCGLRPSWERRVSRIAMPASLCHEILEARYDHPAYQIVPAGCV